jgi:hypothetical protein
MRKIFGIAACLVLVSCLMSGCASSQEALCDAAISAERMLSGLEEASITFQGQKTAYLERQGAGETGRDLWALHRFPQEAHGCQPMMSRPGRVLKHPENRLLTWAAFGI